MPGKLEGKIAILVTHGFEQSEMTEPKKALENAGAKTFVISLAGEQVRGWNHTEWGEKFPVDVPLDTARAADYSALVLPGGVMIARASLENTATG